MLRHRFGGFFLGASLLAGCSLQQPDLSGCGETCKNSSGVTAGAGNGNSDDGGVSGNAGNSGNEMCRRDADCDDDDNCTTDSCDNAVCQHVAGACPCSEDNDCDDGIECTIEFCIDSQCSSTSTCECTVDAECDDADECTTDQCVDGSCARDEVCECSVDSECDDEQDCTTDTCVSGTCEREFICECESDAQCEDDNPCTDNNCTSGSCEFPTNTFCECIADNQCFDNNLCTTGDCVDNKCSFEFEESCFPACDRPSNVITNCDFSAGLAGWNVLFFTGALGTSSTEGGEMSVSITNAGTAGWHVQPRQMPLTLEKDYEYIVNFEARANAKRFIDVSVTQEGGSNTSYSGFLRFELSTEMQQYAFTFTQTADDSTVKLEFMVGGDGGPGILNFDNIYLGKVGADNPTPTCDAGVVSDAGDAGDASASLDASCGP